MPDTLDLTDKLYICPGETHPISRSVHLSRLAAFYPNCRECPLRTETGQLPRSTVERLHRTERRVHRESLFTPEGVRGVYINELTRKKAGEMAAALAVLLWEQSPLIGRADVLERSGHRRALPEGWSVGPRRRPAVVVGHDERPSAPDVVSGVGAALRRMGCQVIDVSLTTRPCFRFAVDHLSADAGLFVTGGGCEPSWTGLDFVGRRALPLSWETEDASQGFSEIPGTSGEAVSHPTTTRLNLNRIEERLRRPFSRSTRHAGPHRTFQALVPYEAGLWKHFHALCPLTLACGCPNGLTRRTLERLFEKLPCRFVPVEVPHRVRNPLDGQDADVARVADAVRENRADVGLLIDDDSQRCGFIDEQGWPVSPATITRLIGQRLLSEEPGESIVIERPATDSLRSMIERAGGTVVETGNTLAEIARAMQESGGLFAGGHSGRYWFRESFPACDAILTLSRILALLSRGDTPFSQIVDDDQ